MERVVLGIDAAWTLSQPSGVAIAAERSGKWHLVSVAPSYERFVGAIDASTPKPLAVRGALPNAAGLLRVATAQCSRAVDLVAVDMPLSHEPITGRRASDDAVSRAYGGKWCATHTPSATRPGIVADHLMMAFAECGYPLSTQSLSGKALIEVYPHPALVELAQSEKRLPYKAQKTRAYWPDRDIAERRALLLATWEEIVALLDAEIVGTRDGLGSPEAFRQARDLKAWEDMLDAIVCAWVGIAALEGRAVPFGDDISAIWIPRRGEQL